MHAGSIPAHAGEPPLPRIWAWMARVYPRPRGGTLEAPDDGGGIRGLSPPTRGNPRPLIHWGAKQRSIPAHAGEPPQLPRSARLCPVYPRPRGGTGRSVHLRPPQGGLSPPTRGNPPPAADGQANTGSIPAHAGEPPDMVMARVKIAVYPRPRGGTSWKSNFRRRALSRTGMMP